MKLNEIFKEGDVVICVEPGKIADLCINTNYIVLGVVMFGKNQKVSINDNSKVYYKSSRFISLTKNRLDKLNKLSIYEN